MLRCARLCDSVFENPVFVKLNTQDNYLSFERECNEYRSVELMIVFKYD